MNATLEFITAAAPGSSVVFDYMPLGVVQKQFDKYPDMRILSSWVTYWVTYKGEPFIFGVPEGKGIGHFQQRGLKVLSDLGPKELEARYLTGSDGMLVGPCASGSRILHATVPER